MNKEKRGMRKKIREKSFKNEFMIKILEREKKKDIIFFLLKSMIKRYREREREREKKRKNKHFQKVLGERVLER